MKRLGSLALLMLLWSVSVVTAQDTPADADELPWWNDRVFYEVFVRSFYDSDGDGVGDLRGLIEKLDYLNDGDPTTTDDLGVTGLWLMPVMESPSYHGYDVSDYYQIAADYGTNADFAELIEAAHARGIVVIVDLVVNHSSTDHPWFVASAEQTDPAYAEYYIWADEDPGYRGPDGQQVWHPYGDRYYYGLFWGGMPDLNYENPAVTAEMEEIARFWLEDMGVDGFRLDAVKHIVEEGQSQQNTPSTHAWMQGFNDFVKSVALDALMVGEIWSGSINIAPYVPDSVDLAFEFDLASTIVDAVRRRSSDALRAIQTKALDLFPPGQYAAFITNHDQDRVMNAFRGDVGSARVAASLLLTNPGVPFLYYGEEIGLQGQKPDERIRTPLPWDNTPETGGFTTGTPWQSLDASAATVNISDQLDDPESLLSHYRALIHLRNAESALRRGDMTLVNSTQRPVYSFLRHSGEEVLLVVINLNHKEIDDYALSLAAGPLTEGVSAEVIFGTGDVIAPTINAEGGFAEYAPLAVLPPRSTTIIRLQGE
jgi:alpha-amylase